MKIKHAKREDKREERMKYGRPDKLQYTLANLKDEREVTINNQVKKKEINLLLSMDQIAKLLDE